MSKTKWWLRIVGVFYLLLTLLNLYAIFVDSKLLEDTLPYALDTNVVRAFTDAWMVFIFELGVVGAVMVYAARTPAQARLLVIAVIGMEIFRGVVADIIWITRDYDAASYVPFIVIHLLIVATGIYLLRREFPQTTS